MQLTGFYPVQWYLILLILAVFCAKGLSGSVHTLHLRHNGGLSCRELFVSGKQNGVNGCPHKVSYGSQGQEETNTFPLKRPVLHVLQIALVLINMNRHLHAQPTCQPGPQGTQTQLPSTSHLSLHLLLPNETDTKLLIAVVEPPP